MSTTPAPSRENRTNPALRQRAYVRGQLASRGAGERQQERVVGTLGMVTQNAPIYRKRSSSSRLLIQCKESTYVALQASEGDWYGILMADGTIGWISKEYVRMLDYKVVAAPGNPASTPTGSDPGDIYPRSEAPYFTGDAQILLQEAYKYLGVRYVWGGNTSNGIDCSGFIKNVFRTQNFDLPRLGSDQMAYGVPVPRDQLQPGDRLYFGRRTERVGVKHTGLYVGNGYFIHASSSNKSVVVSRLDEAYYDKIYVCARR
jgi:cell wall-associated NlpC family hydrolase